MAHTSGRRLCFFKITRVVLPRAQTLPFKSALEAVCRFLSKIVACVGDIGVIWPRLTFLCSSFFSLYSSCKNINVYSYLIFVSNLIFIFIIVICFFLLFWFNFFFDFISIIFTFFLLDYPQSYTCGLEVNRLTQFFFLN